MNPKLPESRWQLDEVKEIGVVISVVCRTVMKPLEPVICEIQHACSKHCHNPLRLRSNLTYMCSDLIKCFFFFFKLFFFLNALNVKQRRAGRTLKCEDYTIPSFGLKGRRSAALRTKRSKLACSGIIQFNVAVSSAFSAFHQRSDIWPRGFHVIALLF